MRRIRSAIGALLAVASGAALPGCGGCTPETCGPTVGMQMRELIARQETHFAQTGRYAPSLDALGLRQEPPVALELEHVDSAGWSARGTHDELPGLSCVAWGGALADPPRTERGTVADEAGRPYCDFPT